MDLHPSLEPSHRHNPHGYWVLLMFDPSQDRKHWVMLGCRWAESVKTIRISGLSTNIDPSQIWPEPSQAVTRRGKFVLVVRRGLAMVRGGFRPQTWGCSGERLRGNPRAGNLWRWTGPSGGSGAGRHKAGAAWRARAPRLFDGCLSDVLTTLTPTELAGHGDWVSCQPRPSHNTPAARRLRAFNITRLIRCGSSSFRPVGSLPGLLRPLQPPGWTGSWPFRREPPNSTGGTLTHERCTLRGLLRSDLFIGCVAPPRFVFQRRGAFRATIFPQTLVAPRR